jgi:hypothetical protein
MPKSIQADNNNKSVIVVGVDFKISGLNSEFK